MSIESEITRLTTAKADLKTAIENKGVTVPSDATLDAYADYVDNISTGGDPTKKWTTDGIMNNLEPSGDLVIESAVDIPQYGMCRRDGITSLRFTSADPVNLGQHAFDTSKNIKSVFVNRLGTMGYYAFAYATELLEVTIKNATDATFENYMCRNTKCKTVKINGTPAQMNESVFKNNGNYRNVYVSWSQGDVANAPWGATNKVTIYFGTVFDNDMNVVSYEEAVNAGDITPATAS